MQLLHIFGKWSSHLVNTSKIHGLFNCREFCLIWFDLNKIDLRSKDVGLKNEQETRLKYTCQARI